MAKLRTPIPDEVAADVLFRHHHTCCVCNEPGHPVQIHHISGDPSDNDPGNLAVLCLHDHERTMARGGFGRQLLADQVIKYRDDWVERVATRRIRADELASARMVAALPPLDINPTKWEPPSGELLRAFLESAPDVKERVFASARTGWASDVTLERKAAYYSVIDVLEQMWTHLASWYPPNHFGGTSARRYVSEYISQRNVWHRACSQPQGEGTYGTMVGEEQAEGVMSDLSQMISETVHALVSWQFVGPFDSDAWENRWSLVAAFENRATPDAGKPSASIPFKNVVEESSSPRVIYTEREIRELLDALSEAQKLVDEVIAPILFGLETAIANWETAIPNKGVRGFANYLREAREQVQTVVWPMVNDFVYTKHARYKDEMRLALALDEEAARGEMVRTLDGAIEALELLPDNPDPRTAKLVAPPFKQVANQYPPIHQWIGAARTSIEVISKNLRSKGVIGFEK